MGKVNFLLVNLGSLPQAQQYAKEKGLQGNALHVPPRRAEGGFSRSQN